MKPGILRKTMDGAPPSTDEEIERRFIDIASSSRVYAVSVDGNERGVIIFTPISGGWNMHLCLGTWHTNTRRCVLRAIYLVASGGDTIHAVYCSSNRTVSALLDDIGFDAGITAVPNWSTHPWTHRKLFIDN